MVNHVCTNKTVLISPSSYSLINPLSVNGVLNASNVFFSMRMVYLHSYCDLVNESAAHSVNFIAITVIKREDPQMLAIDVKLH